MMIKRIIVLISIILFFPLIGMKPYDPILSPIINCNDYDDILSPHIVEKLTTAILQEDLDMLESLITCDKNLLAFRIYGFGCTPLLFAAWKGKIGSVRKFIELGADINQIDNWWKNVLHYAVLSDNAELVAWVMNLSIKFRNGLSILPDKSSLTPLLSAANEGNMISVQKLIELGADVTITMGDYTLLHRAVCSGNADLVAHLWNLEQTRPQREARCRRGTPLLLAALEGHYAVVRKLIELGACTDTINNSGWTLLHYAILGNDYDLVAYIWNLKEAQKQDKKVSASKNQLLHFACRFQRYAIFKYLLLHEDFDPKDILKMVGLETLLRSIWLHNELTIDIEFAKRLILSPRNFKGQLFSALRKLRNLMPSQRFQSCEKQIRNYQRDAVRAAIAKDTLDPVDREKPQLLPRVMAAIVAAYVYSIPKRVA